MLFRFGTHRIRSFPKFSWISSTFLKGAMPGCIKGKFKRNLTAKTGRVGRSSHGNRNQNPKKRFFKVVSRSIAGLVFSTGALCGWQYYRLRRDYVPLKPPKGAVSGIETPLRITEGKDENNLEECQIFFIGDSLVIGIGCPDRLEGYTRKMTKDQFSICSPQGQFSPDIFLVLLPRPSRRK